MDRATYDTYVTRFNAQDATAFEDYLCDDMQMLNGALEFTGIEGMKDHYTTKIWPHFVEDLNVLRFVSDDSQLAVEMRAEFTAQDDFGDTLFGPVVLGEKFVFHGVIMYALEGGRFKRIQVAYNSFSNIKTDGRVVEMGMPH